MATGETKSTQAIDINNASLEDLLSISGIGEKRAKAIIAQRKIKGKLMLEDLKTIPNIPSTLWDPLVDQGTIKIESVLRQSNIDLTNSSTETTQTETQNLSSELGVLAIDQASGKEQGYEDDSEGVRHRQVVEEFEIEIKKRESMIDDLQRECARLRRNVDINAENTVRLKEQMEAEMQSRENEILQKFIDEKEKIRLMNDRERQEDEERVRKKLRELESRERDLDRRETELGVRKRDLDKREKELNMLEQKHISSNIDRIAPHNIYSGMNKDRHSPAPPKLSTYDGKTEWKPYILQFNHIAKKYNWTEAEKLDKLIECLRDRALKFFSSRSEAAQGNFNLLCYQMKERFDRKDQPHIIRRQLQEIKQDPDESIEEFAERIEELATEGYGGMPDYFKNTVTIDAFLRGCIEKRSALVALDKDPKTLTEATQYMKSAITNQKLIGGGRKEVKRVSFNETTLSSPEEPDVRMVNKATPTASKSSSTSLESRILKVEDQQQEHTKLLKEIIKKLHETEPDRRARNRSPDREQPRNRSPSPSKSESESECFRCGKIGHYAKNCSRSRSPSPASFRSPRQALNFRQLKK